MWLHLPVGLPTRSSDTSQLAMRELEGKVTSSHSQGCEFSNWWIVSQHPARLLSTASKYSSNVARSLPPSASPTSFDHDLHMNLRSTWSRPQSASPNLLDSGLKVHLWVQSTTVSKCISIPDRSRPRSLHDDGLQVHPCITRSRPPNASPNPLDLGLQVHLQTRSITACKCISELHDGGLQMHLETRSITASKSICEFDLISASKFISKLARLRPPSASLSSLDHGLPVDLQIRSITASKCIYDYTQEPPPSVSLSSLDRHLQVHLKLLSSTACSQSQYTVCRWVAILMYRYIDENTNWIHEFWKLLNDK